MIKINGVELHTPTDFTAGLWTYQMQKEIQLVYTH